MKRSEIWNIDLNAARNSEIWNNPWTQSKTEQMEFEPNIAKEQKQLNTKSIV